MSVGRLSAPRQSRPSCSPASTERSRCSAIRRPSPMRWQLLTPNCVVCPACSPSPTATSWSPPSAPVSTSSTSTPQRSRRHSPTIVRHSTPTTWNGPARRRSASATSCGRSEVIGYARPTRSPRLPVAARRWPPGPGTWRSSKRCRPSTAWRCAAATPLVSTSSCGTTASTSIRGETRRSPPSSRNGPATSCSRPAPCAPSADRQGRCSRSSTRRPPRSASWATTLRRCGRRSPAMICCGGRCRPRRPRSPCSATRGGRASGSSPSRTPTR